MSDYSVKLRLGLKLLLVMMIAGLPPALFGCSDNNGTTTVSAPTPAPTSTPTLSPVAPPAPTATPAPTASFPPSTSGQTFVSQSVPAGITTLPTASNLGFAIGDRIRIGTGSTQEDNVVTGLSSLILATPTQFPHAAGESVVKLAATSSPSPQRLRPPLIPPASGQTIVRLNADPVSVVESSGTPILFTFTRAGNLSQPLVVAFRVAGTATFGSDYSQTGATSFGGGVGSVTFAAGSDTATVTLTPINNFDIIEPDESVSLTVDTGSYLIEPPATLAATIVDDSAIVRNNQDSGAGSLRQVLLAVNNPQSISNPTVTFTPSVSTILLGSALPALTRDVVITGSGSGLIVDGSNSFRAFQFNAANVTLQNLTIRNSSAPLGSAIYKNGSGSLTLNGLNLINNNNTDPSTFLTKGAIAVENASNIIIQNTTVAGSATPTGRCLSLTNVTNITLQDNILSGCLNEGIGIDNVFGSAVISGNQVSNVAPTAVDTNLEAGIFIRNDSGTSTIQIISNAIQDTGERIDGIEFNLCRGDDFASADRFTDNRFNNCAAASSSSLTLQGNEIRRVGVNAGDGVDFNAATNATLTATIRANLMDTTGDDGITYDGLGNSNSSFSIRDNTINNTKGNANPRGMNLSTEQNAQATFLVQFNTLTRIGGDGMRLNSIGASKINASVSNNTVSNIAPDPATEFAGQVDAGFLARPRENATLCLRLQNNTFNTPTKPKDYLFRRNDATATLQLFGLAAAIPVADPSGPLRTALEGSPNNNLASSAADSRYRVQSNTVQVPTGTCTFP